MSVGNPKAVASLKATEHGCEQNNAGKRKHGTDNGDNKHIAVGLFVIELANAEHGNDCSIVR